MERKYVDFAVNKIEELCKIPSPTGYTKKAEKFLMKTFEFLEMKYKRSIKGNIIVELGGEEEPLVLAAHVDTLGGMVRSIKSNGRIRITHIGGYPSILIENENCIVHTRDGKEFEGTFKHIDPAVHVNRTLGKEERTDKNVELVLDERVSNKEDVEKLGISVGDFVSIDPKTVVTKRGFIKSRHLDDKASAGVLITLAKYIKDNDIKLRRKLYLIFTVYEEVGHGGSCIPDDVVEMISVDMGAVGDDLQTDEYKVSICAKDSGGPYDYDVTTKLINIAKDEKLNYAVDIYPAYGSDVEATLRAGYEIKHGLIGPGVSASHGYERTHREGIENTLELLIKYIQE